MEFLNYLSSLTAAAQNEMLEFPIFWPSGNT
jgi:hypothetical protein